MADEDLVTDIDKFKFKPAANENGAAYATYTFQVYDGTTTSVATYTMTINIAAVLDAPVISDIADQSTNEDTTESGVAFTISDVDSTVLCTSSYLSAASSNTNLIAT
ncbi:MAG: hypothetical protein H6765_10165 [Candidatus Peribacteria bacterium]|nr:MAG: hypothetical protein H6765_10165 [Candidatus Peribacteria bacterium]